MKYIIVLGDGMADEPIGKLGGRTPLQAADTPAMDWLAAHGRCGLLKTVPDGYHPGSEIANLSVLGYDLDRVFEQGEDKNIDVVKREVRQYEKEIKKRGAAVVNQERTKAEKEKTQKTKAKKK